MDENIRPTEQQEAVIEHCRTGRTSLQVQALAGSAKSTTLEMAAPGVKGDAIALAFNKKIADELGPKLPPNFVTKTLNSLGHGAWGKLLGKKLTLDQKKSSGLSRGNKEVRALLNGARTLGMVPEGPVRHTSVKRFIPDTAEGWQGVADFVGLTEFDPHSIEQARDALNLSIEQAYTGLIDFTDQIYMTSCFSGALPRYATVFVDEAQDLSPMNHYMLRKVVSGRAIAVGDTHQAIYAFRGADAASMENLRGLFSMETLPLTTCFRCAKAIVEEARLYVPEIQWAANAPEGKVERPLDWRLFDVSPNSMIVCRNNAPLVKLGFKFLEAGRPIKFQGNDLGTRVETLINKIDREKNLPRSPLLTALTTYVLGQDPERQEYLNDLLNCIDAIPGDDAVSIKANLNTLLRSDTGTIVLSSIHRAKGLEAVTVYILDDHLIPSKYAKTEAAMTQERNLAYVARTRAKRNLIYITSDGCRG